MHDCVLQIVTLHNFMLDIHKQPQKLCRTHSCAKSLSDLPDWLHMCAVMVETLTKGPNETHLRERERGEGLGSFFPPI